MTYPIADITDPPLNGFHDGYTGEPLPPEDRGHMPGDSKQKEPPPPPVYVPTLYTSAEFFKADFRREFLVRGVLVKNQPGVVGGGKKLLKSGAVIDLAVSIDTATPFLGCERFAVPRRANVLLINGESGEATMQETAARIATAHGIKPDKLQITWGTELPQLANADHLEDLAGILKARSIEVMFVDPSYLCLLQGMGPDGPQASNVFDMGPHYLRFYRTCLSVGCTPYLVSHSKKGRNFDPPELDDLAFAGIAESARQWILLSRREAYKHDGTHKLWLSVGGSAGHSSLAHLDIDEGVIDDQFGGRKWEATVTPYGEAQRQRQVDRDEAKQAQRSADEQAVMTMIDKLVDIDGTATQTKVRQGSGISRDRTDAALERLRQSRLIEEYQTRVAAGNKATRPATAYRRRA